MGSVGFENDTDVISITYFISADIRDRTVVDVLTQIGQAPAEEELENDYLHQSVLEYASSIGKKHYWKTAIMLVEWSTEFAIATGSDAPIDPATLLRPDRFKNSNDGDNNINNTLECPCYGCDNKYRNHASLIRHFKSHFIELICIGCNKMFSRHHTIYQHHKSSDTCRKAHELEAERTQRREAQKLPKCKMMNVISLRRIE